MLIKRMIMRPLLAALSLCFLCSVLACPAWAEESSKQDADRITEEGDASYAPHTKEDGSKYSLTLLDYDEYMPSSRQFYYILSGLMELGWIKEDGLPFTMEDVEAQEMPVDVMCKMLEEADLGPYLEFSKDAFHYLAYEEESDIAEDLKKRAGSELDLIITSGTSAGLFVKELELPIPLVDYSATDPVASGIIDSATEGTGNPNVWAQVEPSLPLRQLRYYYSIKPFTKLGIIVYGDEIISGVPDIEACAEELGFEIVKYNIEEQKRETDDEIYLYYADVRNKLIEMADEDIDAFFLTVDLINDTSRLQTLLFPLYNKRIPIYLMDDVNYVRDGCLMLISANDMENVGRFVADTISKILGGEEAGSLPCVYTSAPSIYLNYDIAKRIHYPLNFEFLTVCDQIFIKEGGQ